MQNIKRTIKLSFLIPALLLTLIFASCNFKQREAELDEKSRALAQKELQLLTWENNLQLKEDSVRLLILRDSSSVTDSIAVLPPSLAGEWIVKMICIETNCSGSAIGDVQTDTWQISSLDSSLVIKSIVRGKVNRAYTGNYFMSNTIRASVPLNDPAIANTSGRFVEITDIRENKMRGTRIVTQPDGCRIIYSIELDKKR